MSAEGNTASVLDVIHSVVELLRPLDDRQRAYVLRGASGRLGELAGGADDWAGFDEALSRLSRREREVFRFLADAHSNAEIGAALCISAKTVESHRGRIFKKLDVHSLVDLVRLAARATAHTQHL
jgi:DNA-binding CsgD family transcriptional regulator